jgi:hypothetical protein
MATDAFPRSFFQSSVNRVAVIVAALLLVWTAALFGNALMHPSVLAP